MLAKILLTILGVLGLVMIVDYSPTPLNIQTQKPAVISNEAPAVDFTQVKSTAGAKQPTDTAGDGAGKSGDFTGVKSPAEITKLSANTAMATSAVATQPIKTPEKFLDKDKTVGTAIVYVATSSLAISGTLSASSTPYVDFNAINQIARKAIVNIFCTSKNAGSFDPLSASGVMIDPRGIILTNAHVAEYFLLKDYGQKDFLSCVGRTGSPAVPQYTLKILYISPQWMKDNYAIITTQKPTGTGENDFALLQVASSTNPDVNLPESFPFLSIDSGENNIKTGTPAVLASYPAGFLGGIAIQRDLYLVSTVINIGKVYTFKTGSLDVFSLGGSPVAQHGSSGGAAVSTEGKLLGIIVTSTDAVDTSARDLDAISISHINRSLFDETGLTLQGLFSSNISAFSSAFDEQVLPAVKKLLFDELDSKNR